MRAAANPGRADGFDAISAMLARETSIRIGRSKEILLRARIGRRIQELGLTGYDDYLNRLSCAEGRAETEQLISALTTGVTSFFRERHQFETLRKEILPGLIRDAEHGRPVRLWSAGCATGEEAWSLALCIRAECPDWRKLNIRILATDIDQAALTVARAGRYARQGLKAIPADLRGLVPRGADFSELGSLVAFRRLNLHSNWPMRRKFNAIMCRNTAIYFSPDVQQSLWLRLAHQLQPGGSLFIGHSERITGSALALVKREGIKHYRRNTTTSQEALANVP